MNKIAVLNDTLRRTFAGGKVVMTRGVAALPENECAQVLERVLWAHSAAARAARSTFGRSIAIRSH